MSGKESCMNCKCFLESDRSKKAADKDDRHKRHGVCRRYPPALEKVRGECFPVVFSNDWCGEWK